MITQGIRTTALDRDEKAELERLLVKMQLMPQSGKIVLHISQGKIAGVEPQWKV
ncbi:MAG: hypothetical protein PVSMB11_11130 [Desulfuromonadaceae bacterium]